MSKRLSVEHLQKIGALRQLQDLVDECYAEIHDAGVDKGLWSFKSKVQKLAILMDDTNAFYHLLADAVRVDHPTVAQFCFDTVKFLTEGKRHTRIHTWETILCDGPNELRSEPVQKQSAAILKPEWECVKKLDVMGKGRPLRQWLQLEQGLVDMVCTTRILLRLVV